MFRCITKLKGLIIDLDSFGIETLHEWESLQEQYIVVFLTAHKEYAEIIKSRFGENSFQPISRITRFTAPNIFLNTSILDIYKLKNTEIVYVSKDLYYLRKAMTLMNGTIWVTDSINYEEAGTMPDLVCSSIERIEIDLKKHIYGFFGEVFFNPLSFGTGLVLPVEFPCDGHSIQLYTIGRYFGYQHYMSQLHPYSSAIWWNKRKNSKSYGLFNEELTKIFLKASVSIKEIHKIECICSVPARPSEENRFTKIVETVSKETGLTDVSRFFNCVKEYAPQKQLTEKEREINIRGVFQMSEDLKGRNVLIVDDIATTGSTLRECARELFKHNAGDVIVLVLAINQKDGTYWSSERPGVICPHCGTKMGLFINSNSKQFFFSCPNDNMTYSFPEGEKNLVASLNQMDEIKNRIFKDNEGAF